MTSYYARVYFYVEADSPDAARDAAEAIIRDGIRWHRREAPLTTYRLVEVKAVRPGRTAWPRPT